MTTMTQTLIMAVPFDMTRVKNAKAIRDQTGGQVVWDREQSFQETFLRLLATAGDDPVIVLQDDVELAENFCEEAERVIAEHPDMVCKFFSMRSYAEDDTGHEVRGSSYMMNQAFYLPAGYARQLADYAAEWFTSQHRTGDDTCIAHFLKERRERFWQHVPSIVQHKTMTSVVDSRRSTKRQAKNFSGGE